MKTLRHIWGAVLLALPVTLCATVVEGAFLLNFTGNTFPQNGPPTTVDAHVNFAVLDRTGGVAGDTWGTGLNTFDAAFSAGVNSNPLDTGAKYLYLFQSVNDGINTEALSQNTVGLADGAATSFGYYSGAGFTSNGADVGAGNSLGPSATAGDPSGISLAALPGVTLIGAGLLVPDFITDGSNSLVASFIFVPLASGTASTLWGYTSNFAPTWGPTSIQDGGTNASGTVPVPKVIATVPEPVTVLIWSVLGLAWMGMAMVRRRQGTARSPWSEEARTAIHQLVAGK